MADHSDTRDRSDATRCRFSRRRLVALAGAFAAAVTAGCRGTGDGSEDTEHRTTDSPGDPESPTTTPAGRNTATATQTGTATGTQTETSTATETTVAPGFDASVLDGSPSSTVAPTDGFADADWLAGAFPEIVRVTTLEASGEGSLRWALNRPGPRVVVFEVGGVVDLQGQSLSVSRPHVWVAGQTAPSPGITLVRGGIGIEADDVILQHLHVRPGDEIPGPIDCIGNGDGSNVIVDHCSATWGTDESISTNAGAANPDITFANNLIAEALNDSIHPKGEHSYGTLVMDRSKRVTIAGNLWANNVGRHPRLKGGSTSVVANNVAYNFERALNLGGGVADETVASIVGNYYRGGELTDANDPVVGTTFTDATGPIRAFIAFNETDPASIPVVRSGSRIERVSQRPLWPEGLETSQAGAAYEGVLAGAGARPADRAAIDRRIVGDVRNRTGGLVDSQSEVGGYPEHDATRRELQVPETGLAEWLRSFTVAVERP